MIHRWLTPFPSPFKAANDAMYLQPKRLREIALCKCFPWTLKQFARLFPDAKDPQRTARAYSARMLRKGLLQSGVVDCQCVVIGSEPLCTSIDEKYDIHEVAYRLEQRFSGASKPTRIFWPSTEFSKRFGAWTGSDIYPCPHKASHDLIVTSVWLRFLEAAPELAIDQWESERFMTWIKSASHERGPAPDAAICDQGELLVAIEIGGNYPASWIQHHIDGFERKGWNWEIW